VRRVDGCAPAGQCRVGARSPASGRPLVGVGKPASLEFGPLVRIDSGEATRFSAAPALIGQNGQAKAVAQPGLPLT
jgi:hypothetical protein